MAPTTDPSDIPAFYDWLSHEYDRMTSFEERFARERPSIQALVDVHGIRTALDAGTGTGFHALLLAQLGVRVTAVDISPAMIEELLRHAAGMSIEVTGLVGSFEEIPDLVHSPQDAVFSLGNTLAHSESRQDLLSTLTAFRRVLRPGGVLIAQLLNYRRILSSRESVQIVREAGSTRFVRWYEYAGDRIRFHVTREQIGSGEPAVTRSVVLRPVTDDELGAVLPEAGFDDVRFAGGITLAPYDPVTSKDCVVTARNPLRPQATPSA
jgi:glycine/sarcosine N-methyltransferase